MLYHYPGLSAQQVIDNRQRFGENVIKSTMSKSLIDKLQQVSTFWLIHVLVIIQLVAFFILLILDIFLSNITLSDVLILVLLAGVILLVYLVATMVGHWNTTKNRYELDHLTTTMLIVLTVACFFTYYRVAFDQQHGILPYWGVIIVGLAVIMASTITYLFERKMTRRLLSKNNKELVEVIREGSVTLIPSKEIVVGDIILLKKGDEVPADAELLEAKHLIVDESPLLGNSKCHKKPIFMDGNNDFTFPPDQIMKGSIVLKGEGVAEVFAVGTNTFISNL